MRTKEELNIINNSFEYYKHILYITKENAENLILRFGSGNKGYEISDNGKEFYKITKDKNGRCGDFICRIPTEEELEIINAE